MDERLRRLTERILADAEALSLEVRGAQGEISMRDARQMVRACREAEGWLAGIRTVLLDAEEGPGPSD